MLPASAAHAIEPLFSSAVRKLTEAQPTSTPPKTFLAAAAASSVGLKCKKKPQDGSEQSLLHADASTQSTLPWLGHAAGSSFAQPTGEPRTTNSTSARGYLDSTAMTEALEAMMDAALVGVSEASKRSLDDAPKTAHDWQQLAAENMLLEAGLEVVAAHGSADVGVQCSTRFISHAMT